MKAIVKYTGYSGVRKYDNTKVIDGERKLNCDMREFIVSTLL